MGQAWCKERATKAQDSKSPLDRVFVRCAHQIYPTLKQDGSVLGGATQRVTSSEIGYAGSPPREALTRGESVDSIDRPFHPSDWVDVNLEVPSTPCSAITNLTANTSLYQTTTLSSTGSNLKNITPIPPPRRRRKNRGRPLPPKPDEVTETHKKFKQVKNDEPLYSSVKSSKLREREGKGTNDESISKNLKKKPEDFQDAEERGDNKANGVAKISPVAEENRLKTVDNREEKEKGDENENQEKTSSDQDLEGYEKFSKIKDLRNSSTPNGPGKNTERESTLGKDLRDFMTTTIIDDDVIPVPVRPKNYSTVSLPNYDELEHVKMEVEREAAENEDSDFSTPKKSGRGRNVSTSSLPVAEIVGSLSEKTAERIEKYITRCRSFGSLQPNEIFDKLKAHGEEIESSDEDEWGGLDDWDTEDAEFSGPSDGRPPLEPRSRLKERKDTAPPKFIIGEHDPETTREEVKIDPKNVLNGTETKSEKKLTIPRNASFEIPKSPTSLKSAMKLEVNRKISTPAKFLSDKPGSPVGDWIPGQERSVRFFDDPKLEEEYANSPGFRPVKPTEIKKEVEYDMRSYPFNGLPSRPLDIDNFFDPPKNLTETKSSIEPSSRPKNLTRSLSNESEPFDAYEEKELTLDIRSQHSSIGKMSRTISDESIPAEMNVEVEDSSIDNNTAKSIDSKTPPPSPEPKIKAEILSNDHFSSIRPTSLKIPKDEDGESNLSSMTPSLTELEAALSDMLEKEDHDDTKLDKLKFPGDSEDSRLKDSEVSDPLDKPIEPKIVPKSIDVRGKDAHPEETSNTGNNLFVRRRKENAVISLGQILNNSGITVGDKIPGKNPFEDTDDDDNDDRDGKDDFGKGFHTARNNRTTNPFDGEPPEKPSRLHKIFIDQNNSETEKSVMDFPTPPQRKNKHGAISPVNKNNDSNHSDSEFPIRDSTPHPNDRLI